MHTLEANLETALSSFDIDYGAAAQARGHGAESIIPSNQFMDEAGGMLEDLSGLIMELAVPNLPDLAGRWHPSGFMVFPMGMHPQLGSLRLHIWPQELRNIKERGHGLLYSHKWGLVRDGDIHNHAWDIISQVIKGYSDNIVGMNPIGEDMSWCIGKEGKQEYLDIYRIHRVDYDPYGVVTLKPHYLDAHNSMQFRHAMGGSYGDTELRPNPAYTTPHTKYGGWVYAGLVTHRDCEPGTLHRIDAGVLHTPTIPYGRFAATLAWNSYRRGEGPDILQRGPITTRRYDRNVVTREEAEIARDQLLNPPAEKFGLLSTEQALGLQALKGSIKLSERMRAEGKVWDGREAIDPFIRQSILARLGIKGTQLQADVTQFAKQRVA